MLDIFSPLPPAIRRENRAAYKKYIMDRDGTLDLENKTLSRREENMARYSKPLPTLRTMDRQLFTAQYVSFDPQVPTSPETLLLIALVKANANEAFGVHRTYDRAYRRAIKNEDDLELTLLVEETYHTRILLSAAVLYGVEVTGPYKPSPALRAFISAIAHFPEFLSRPLTLAGEILGTLMFLNLLEKSNEVLRHDPELRDSVQERLCEILIDELGHISFNRMCLGPAGLAQAKTLLPLVARGLSTGSPELAALGAVAQASDGDVVALGAGHRLPASVKKAAFLS